MINSLQGVLQAMLSTSLAMTGESSTLGRAVTYQTYAEPVYDPQTGDVTTPSPQAYSLTAVLMGYTAREVLPDVVLMTDQKALILVSALEAVRVTPQTRDCVVIDGIVWRVVSIQKDPAGVTFILQLRRESSAGAS